MKPPEAAWDIELETVEEELDHTEAQEEKVTTLPAEATGTKKLQHKKWTAWVEKVTKKSQRAKKPKSKKTNVEK